MPSIISLCRYNRTIFIVQRPKSSPSTHSKVCTRDKDNKNSCVI